MWGSQANAIAREGESQRERANLALVQEIRTRESANENNQQIYK